MKNDLIWVKAKCNDYYKVIKNLQLMHVFVYEVKYENKVIYLKIESKDFEKLKKYLVSYKFKIISLTGFRALWQKIKQEKIFVIALIFGLALLFLIKNLIVEVNVIHENKEIRELIEDELDNYGIKVLHFKKSYHRLDEIRQEILDKYPDKLDWMEFVVEGMSVNVRVEERIITDTSKENKTCNLVATKAGIIDDIVVYSGEANVQINDYVRAGDILVKGIITYNEENKRATCASGEVYATVWYTASVSIPFSYTNYEETGKKRYNFVWEKDGNKKEILRSRFANHNSYYKNLLHVFDFNLYLETEQEVKKIEGEYNEKEALEAGILKATESIETKLGEKDQIIDKKVLQSNVNDSTMDIEVFFVARQLISSEALVEIEEGID